MRNGLRDIARPTLPGQQTLAQASKPVLQMGAHGVGRTTPQVQAHFLNGRLLASMQQGISRSPYIRFFYAGCHSSILLRILCLPQSWVSNRLGRIIKSYPSLFIISVI
jgi:hypothetical protein